MISLNRLVLMAIALAQLGCSVQGFVGGVPTPRATAPLVTSYLRERRSNTELSASSRRREIFGKLRKAFLAGGVASVFKGSEPALAEDATPSPVTGRVVVLEIGNVGGEEGKTGTVKIQLHPEWAPIGTKRFEKLTEENFWDGCRYVTVVAIMNEAIVGGVLKGVSLIRFIEEFSVFFLGLLHSLESMAILKSSPNGGLRIYQTTQ